MNRRKMMRGGAALALAAVLAMSGCGGNGTADGGTSAGGANPAEGKPADAPKDAKAALVAATTKLQEQSFRTTIDMGAGGTMAGVMDPKSKSGEFKMEAVSEGTKITSDMRIVEGVTYIKLTMPGVDMPGMDGKTWRKLAGNGEVGTMGNFDAADIAKSLDTAADVKWAGDNAVTGTIDLAKSSKQLGMGAVDLSKLSTTTMPFEAGFDGEGRLARYTFTTPAIGTEAAAKMDIKYSDFGVPVKVEVPPAAQIAS